MTSASVVDATGTHAEIAVADRAQLSLSERFDSYLEMIGERLNPILVKEARQALKSRQFVATFALLLLSAWGWSLIGVSLLTPGVYFAPSGGFLLVGYFLILAIPLLIVVPFSAFWSLAREREDQTFELLSITTLSSRQIITGKLGSAVVQMLVYYSALAPCIAFTYLLRGVDVLGIALLLAGTFVVSVLFSLVGLTMAALTQTRHWQMLIAVFLLLALVLGSIFWVTMMIQIVGAALNQLGGGNFWMVVFALFTGAVSYVVLLVRVAAAQISFASDNRATPVRQAMLGQLALFAGWMGYAFVDSAEDDVLYITLTVSAIHWALYGILMNGETAELSPRAKRRLPHSLLGRSFFTWFNPGAETGYVFSVATFTALTLTVLGWNVCSWIFRDTGAGPEFFLFATMMWSYFVFYLGLGRSLVSLLGRFVPSGFFVSLVVHVAMLLVVSLVPTFVQSWLEGFVDLSYSVLQTPNWFWTIAESAGSGSSIPDKVTVLVPTAAAVMLVWHLTRAAQEVRYVRAIVPERVREDDQLG